GEVGRDAAEELPAAAHPFQLEAGLLRPPAGGDVADGGVELDAPQAERRKAEVAQAPGGGGGHAPAPGGGADPVPDVAGPVAPDAEEDRPGHAPRRLDGQRD